MLLEMAVGDALGCCFEWTDKWIVKTKNNLRYITLEENPSLIKPGNYTDDTQMSMAIAEFMLSDKEWDHYNIAEKFVECFHRDPRRGYAPGFYLFLLDHKNGTDFVHDIRPNSERSGAAMRAAPVGLIKNIDELIKNCNIQSSLTHNNKKGKESALCVALATNYFRYELGAKKDLMDWLGQHFSINLSELLQYDHIPVEGWPCVMAALDAVNSHDCLSEILKYCINFAGDTDTIATIAMGMASVCKEIRQDLPDNLISGLENDKYGRDYIIDLDKRLLANYD